MSKVIIYIVIITLVGVGFYFALRQPSEPGAPPVVTSGGLGDLGFRPEKIKIFWEKSGTGITYFGGITFPTPCYTLQASGRLVTKDPELVLLELSSRVASGVCIQVLSEKKFSITIPDVSGRAAVRAFFNDKLVPNELKQYLAGPSQ